MSTLEIHVTTAALVHCPDGKCIALGSVPSGATFSGIRQTDTVVALRFDLPAQPCTARVGLLPPDRKWFTLKETEQ